MTATILVVEDHERNRKLARTVLEYRGYTVVECDDGEPSLALARAHRPALVLMDIQLPTMDGITALRRLRADAQTASIPVIAVTASVTTKDVGVIAKAGFDGYVAKPIRYAAFMDAVRSHLEKASP